MPAIAALCARSLGDAPDEDAIRLTLFDTDDPPIVRGDPDRGVVASVVRQGWTPWRDAGPLGCIRLLVVDPATRREGLGALLLAEAESDLASRRCDILQVGADAPDYLFPGVDASETATLALLESAGFARQEPNVNMVVGLTEMPDVETDSVTDGTPGDRDELTAWFAANFPNWADEGLRGLDRASLVISRDERGISGFCAWDVNRRGWLGPMAVRRGERGRGTGTPLLLAALRRMRDSGLDRAEIAWVGPIGFYSKAVGATVGRVYIVHRKRL